MRFPSDQVQKITFITQRFAFRQTGRFLIDSLHGRQVQLRQSLSQSSLHVDGIGGHAAGSSLVRSSSKMERQTGSMVMALSGAGVFSSISRVACSALRI